MLKERHRNGVAVPRTQGASSRAQRQNIVPPDVGIIPGNRFFLLPLKKVSALVRHHDPCRSTSATSTKTCIETKASANRAMSGNMASTHSTYKRSFRPSNRLIVKGSVRQRHRHPATAKTSHLGLISERGQERTPLLDDQGNGPRSHTAGVARTRKLLQERTENARTLNTHIYFRKAGRQEEPNPRTWFTQKPASEPLERGGLQPKGASAVDYLSLVLIDSAHQSAHVVSTELTSRTGAWSQNRWRSKPGTSIFTLELQPAQEVVELRRKLDSLGDRQSHGAHAPQRVYPVDDTVLQKRGTSLRRTRFSAEREPVSVSDLAATASKHEGWLSCEQRRTVDGQPRRKGKKKLRNVVVLPRMQNCGRNRTVSPSDHRILLPTDHIPVVGYSCVNQTRSSWRRLPFLCSLANGPDDLPVGPLRGTLKQQLLG